MKKTGKILAALGLAVAFGAILNPTQAKAEDTDRIAQGVYIGNIDVGGMTEQEALNAVTDYVNNAGEAVFTLTAGEHKGIGSGTRVYRYECCFRGDGCRKKRQSD